MATVSDSIQTTNTNSGGVFYARSSAVGDGHDAFPGFAYVTT